ncbi:MAG: flagellar basal-body rod protein FlgG [Phycisphaerae bacterium]|nr:flagellar basal-body rod protein FlgG [Phycisphaerae bacterium]
MTYIALNTAATGLDSMSTKLDVIANNLANINTPGFKSNTTSFEDLMYIERQQPGLEDGNGYRKPLGLNIGLGTNISGTQLDFSQGSQDQTNQPLDVLIDGTGLFRVEVPQEFSENGIGYTRNGHFQLNEDGQLVLANSTGNLLISNVTIDPQNQGVQIRQDGEVFYQEPGAIEMTKAGRIEIASFVNPGGLKSVGQNIYVETVASGEPLVGSPGEDDRGTLLQGSLEASNVQPVVQLVDLIKTQRAFEMNSQVIQAANEALQQINNLRRF